MKGSDPTVIIGAGPAGLACAYALSQKGRPAIVLEQDEEVGGLCRTLEHNGDLFDIGGHRFLTRSPEVQSLWLGLLDGDLLRVPRRSRVYYRGNFYKYPLALSDTLKNLGLPESLRCAGSYLRARLFPSGDERTFEGWVSRRFGRRLFETFFDKYTQKVWGLPCRRLSSDWADQRIHGLSLGAAAKDALFGPASGRPKTYYDEFLYPRRGPGQFFSILRERSERAGAKFLLNTRVTGLRHRDGKIVSVEVRREPEGRRTMLEAGRVFSSMPASALAAMFDPPPPPAVREAAAGLRFRNFLSVNVLIDRPDLFPDQWIYVHAPDVRMCRVQNFKNWSPAMVRSASRTTLGLEYFCSGDEEIWRAEDADLLDLAVGELEIIGLAKRPDFVEGFVVRRENAYPVYDLDYRLRLGVLRDYLELFSNFQSIGRGGLFRYGNSDLAMLTGLRAAENATQAGRTDLWTYDVGN